MVARCRGYDRVPPQVSKGNRTRATVKALPTSTQPPSPLMNVDDRMGSCRDKGRMWGRVGAWCLSLVATRSIGDFVEHPNEDKHQAPSSTPPRPLSLQDPGPQAPQWIGFPDSVVNIHQNLMGFS